MYTRVGPYSREQPKVRNYLRMRFKKAVTNSIQEEVMSTYTLPKRYDLKGFGHSKDDQREATEMRVEKVRVYGCSTIVSPTFTNDVGTD